MSGQKTRKKAETPRPFIAGVAEEQDPFWIARRVRITENGVCNEVILSHSGKILGFVVVVSLVVVLIALQVAHMNAEHAGWMVQVVEAD